MGAFDLFGKQKKAETLCEKGVALYEQKQYDQALKYLIKAEELGDVSAQMMYGTMIFGGMGAEQDIQKGISYIKKAAQRGYVPALMTMSNLCASEDYGCKDTALAFEYMSKAAESGYDDAQYQLGLMYGASGKLEEAYKWFALAADQGHEKAIKNCEMLLADFGEA